MVFHSWILTELAEPLVENDGPHKADAIVVMGGDQFCTRVVKGAQLAQAGWAPLVYVSSPPIFTAHESDFTIPYAEERGYPAKLFEALPSNVDSTQDEAVYLGKVMREHHVQTLLLVTSNYHTARAARLMRRNNPGLTVYAEPAPDPYFTVSGWWKSRSGEKTFLLEWMKTVESLLRI